MKGYGMRIRDHYLEFSESMNRAYIAIRKLIGILGMSLPVLLIIPGALIHQQTADSLSGYYYTSLRDVLVAVLFAAGLLLIVYRGGNKTDRYLTTLAGILAMLIVVFPISPTGSDFETANRIQVGIFQLPAGISWAFHLAFAFSFFVVMGIVSLFRFTKHQPGATEERVRLNFRYRICGLFIWVGAVFTLVVKLFFKSDMLFYPVLAAESIILAAIGYGWFLKGNKKAFT